MDLLEIAEQLSVLLETNRSLFLKTEPEVPDFTVKSSFKILLFSETQRLDLDVDSTNIVSIIAMFDCTIFDKERVDRIYTWNFKALCSYFHFCTEKFITPTTSLIDLKPIESFLGIKKNSPENFIKAINRTKVAVQLKGWQSTYKAIHLPLSLRVLPSIETTPVLNIQARRTEHPYYEIEGQVHGRMNCLKKYNKCYTPHNMGPEIRASLKPKGYGCCFLYSDFHNCEICVLQWLTGDTTLKELLDAQGDFYSNFYEKITNNPCDSELKRKKAKSFLIAFIYGGGAKTLAEDLGISEEVASELIRRVKLVLTTSCKWLDDLTNRAKTETIYDYFGRPRNFKDEPYKSRNAVIQATAATFCQEKLISLYRALDGKNLAQITFSVHDGYGLTTTVAKARQSYLLVKEILSSESIICPGLQMKVGIKFGGNLEKMKVLWKD